MLRFAFLLGTGGLPKELEDHYIGWVLSAIPVDKWKSSRREHQPVVHDMLIIHLGTSATAVDRNNTKYSFEVTQITRMDNPNRFRCINYGTWKLLLP